jgi:hypothetical protein
VIDPATGRKVGSSFSSQSQAEQYMQQQAATAPTHHSVKYLDSAGRANRTVRAETLPHPGTNRNTIDDVFKMHGNLASAARLAKKNDKAPTRAGGVRGDVLLSSIQQAHGFDSLPQKVNKQTLDNMLKSGDVSRMMYRAAGGFERDYQDGTMFSAGDNGRRMGAGAYAGSSTSTSRGGKNEANLSNVKNYIKGFGRVAQTNTVRMGLRADARTIGHREMRRERKQWVARERARLSRSDPNYQDKVAVIDAFERDPGYYAAAMGYDAVISDRKDFRGFTGVMILNRSATVVQDTIESIT